MNLNLVKLFELCGKYKIDFIYQTQKGDKNSIIFENDKIKRVIVTINNPHDENLKVYINSRTAEIENVLEQLFSD